MLFRFVGGKFYALKYIEAYWQTPHEEYREPFVGGGSVFFAKPKAEYNWLNDMDADLMTTYRVMADDSMRPHLMESLRVETASRERHGEIKARTPRSNFETAFRFYYLNRTSFSGKMRNPTWGYRPKRSLPPHRWHERIVPCGAKLADVRLTNGDFEAPITAPGRGRVLMYIDPPYFVGKNNGHYACRFEYEDHMRLSRLLKRTKHRFFLTYDDSSEIRSLYEWAVIRDLDFVYRVDNSRMGNDRRFSGNEVVISNYEPGVARL